MPCSSCSSHAGFAHSRQPSQGKFLGDYTTGPDDFEMLQMVWYRGSDVTIKEQREKGHSTQHFVEGGHEQYVSEQCLRHLPRTSVRDSS